MKIEVREVPKKSVLFWLSREEAADEELMRSVKSQFKSWNEKGYLPVIFESGTKSLEDGLYMLMKHNFEVLAKKQLAAEQ